MVDHLGLMISVAVHPANVQDRDGVGQVLTRRTRARFPFIEVVFADGGYRGERAAQAARASGSWRIEIVARNETGKGFVLLAKRWIIERTLGWISRHRRLARDVENLARSALAFIRLAMIKLMLRRLARAQARPQS